METTAQPSVPRHVLAQASWLGQALHAAEQQFGPRDMSFTILGCEYAADGPHIWLPGFADGRKHAVVQLGPHAFVWEANFLWQLAHEAVHLLDPAPRGANVLEEGIAVRFAREFMLSVGRTPLRPTLPSYAEAVQLVDELEQGVPGAARALRERAGRWRDVTPEVFLEVAPGYDPQKVERLVGTFVRS